MLSMKDTIRHKNLHMQLNDRNRFYNDLSRSTMQDQRKLTWEKIADLEKHFRNLKERITEDRKSGNISLDSMETVLTLSALSMVLGEIGWRQVEDN